MLTAKGLAEMLNGRQHGLEISPDEEREAREAGLVVVFGSFDNSVELRGAIDDRIDAFGGTTIFVCKDGKLLKRPDCNNPKCTYFKTVTDSAKKIQAEWYNSSPGWTFKTSILHETFSILEGENQFCEGIVFSLEGVREENTPLTLEELLEMDGEPVFCISINNPTVSAYGIMCNRDRQPYIRTHEDKGRKSRFFYLATLGSDWLAYRHRPAPQP